MNPIIRELQKIRLYDKRISIMQNEIDRLRASATGITPAYGGEVVSSSHSQDKLGESVSAIVDLEKTIADLRRKRNSYLAILNRIPTVVDKPKEAENQIDVLYGHYFEYKSFRELACEMECSERKVCYIHGRALQSYGALMNGGVDNGESGKSTTIGL